MMRNNLKTSIQHLHEDTNFIFIYLFMLCVLPCAYTEFTYIYTVELFCSSRKINQGFSAEKK